MLPTLAVRCMVELQLLGVRKQCASARSIDKCFSSGSVDAGFVLALPFHHGDFEPDCVGVLTRGGVLMCGIKIPPRDFALKMQWGGA